MSRGAIAEGAGFHTGATWATEVALAAADGLKLGAAELEGGPESLPVEEIGDPEGGFPERGNEAWEGPLRGNVRYGGNCGRFVAHMIGGETTTPNTGTTTHTCDWTDDLARFFTFARGRNQTDKWRVWPSMKIHELVLAWVNGGRVTFEARCIGNQMLRDSLVNTRAVTNLVTVPAGRAQIMGASGVLRMNSQSGGALAGGDAVKIMSGRIVMRRPPSRVFETSGLGKIAEPEAEGANEILLELDLQRYRNDDFIDQWEAATAPTARKADIFFASGFTPPTGLEMTWRFQFPNLQLAARPQEPVPGPGIIPHRLVYKATGVASAPTGMTGVTAPLRAVIEDERLTSYFGA